MRKKAGGGLCLLAAVMVLALGLAAGTGTSLARYRVSASRDYWGLPEEREGPTSSLLTADGRDVLLADRRASEAAEIRFTVSDEAAAPETFSLVTADGLLNPTLTVEAGAAVLTLTPTEAAEALAEPQAATITVSWQGLSAQISLRLLPESWEADAGETGTDGSFVTLSGQALASGALGTDRIAALRVTEAADGSNLTLTFTGEGGAALQGVSCSFDGGLTWMLLYDRNDLTFCPETGWNGLLLLDLSGVADLTETGLQVRVDGVQSLSNLEGLPCSRQPEPFLLTRGESQSLDIQKDWLDCGFTWELQRLSRTEEGGVAWEAAPETERPEVTETEAGLALSVTGTQAFPPAGSYRLVLRWQSGDTVLWEAAIPFHITYSLLDG